MPLGAELMESRTVYVFSAVVMVCAIDMTNFLP